MDNHKYYTKHAAKRFRERFNQSLTDEIAIEIGEIINTDRAEILEDFLTTQGTYKVSVLDQEMIIVYSLTEKMIITIMPKHYSIFQVKGPRKKKIKPTLKKFK